MAADLAAIGKAISGVRGVLWTLRTLWGLIRFLRPEEPAVFGVEWRLYDGEPGPDNAAGIATLKRSGIRRGRMVVLRSKEADEPQTDTKRVYLYEGFLRDRKLVLTWVAQDRPDTFVSPNPQTRPVRNA